MKILEKTRKNLQETNRQVVLQTTGLISSAFVLVAALAWNEAIKDLISRYTSAGNTFLSKIIYAIIVTFIAVAVTSRLNSIAERLRNDQTEQQ